MQFNCLGFTSVSRREAERRETHPTPRTNTSCLQLQVYQWRTFMAGLVALCLLLVLPLSSSQSALQEADAHPALHLRDLLRQEETSHVNAKQTYAHVYKDNAKVGLFIAAAMGTITLMAAVYCIYNKFYTKQQYLHTQLHDDQEFAIDSVERPPVFFHGSAGSTAADGRKTGYGSLLDTPSIISVPPSLSPPPAVTPFPPLFLSSHSLRTISARDLEKSFL